MLKLFLHKILRVLHNVFFPYIYFYNFLYIYFIFLELCLCRIDVLFCTMCQTLVCTNYESDFHFIWQGSAIWNHPMRELFKGDLRTWDNSWSVTFIVSYSFWEKFVLHTYMLQVSFTYDTWLKLRSIFLWT